MSEYFSKTDGKYFEKLGTESGKKEPASKPALSPKEQFESDLLEKSAAYRKVTPKFIVKRYAIRKD